MQVGQMDITSWNENTGEPRVWKLTSAVRRRAGGKGPSHRYLACCLSYYDLNEPLPDHSSLTKIRTRYGIEVFRRFFEVVVEQCQQAGLVWGRELYIDATKVQANASRDSVKPRFAVESHLRELFATEVNEESTITEPELVIPTPLPVILSDETREELAVSNEARHEWIEQEGAQDRSVTGRNYQRVADFQMSTTDPDATIMLSKDGAHLGYQTHYVVDGGKARIILAALVAPAEVMENQPMLDLVFRTCFRWKLRPRQVTGDRKYGTEENIVALETQHIRAYLALPDPDHRTPFFSSDRFRYVAERDVYLCPAGKELHFAPWHSTERSLRYRAYGSDCNSCPLKAQCTTGKQGRSLCRSIDEEVLERVRGYHETEAYKKAYRKRTVWVEPLFAEGKDWHGMRRFRLRLLWRVNCEALTRAAGQNLKRLLKQRGWGRRPYPSEAVSVLFLASSAWVTRLFGVLAFFLADMLRLLNNYEVIHCSLLTSFVRAVFQQAGLFFSRSQALQEAERAKETYDAERSQKYDMKRSNLHS